MNKKNSLLLIEDNLAIAKQISSFLEGIGWQIDFASVGELGLKLAIENTYDVILLDLNLPDIDGIALCSSIKSSTLHVMPILMVTARDTFEDKARGFSSGADDYITKPFDLRELALRCEALTRRSTLHTERKLTKGHLCVDLRSNASFWQGNSIVLTGIGFKILHKLLEAYPYPVSRSELVSSLWGEDPPESNALKSHIYSLRKALPSVSDTACVERVSNVGYILKGIE